MSPFKAPCNLLARSRVIGPSVTCNGSCMPFVCPVLSSTIELGYPDIDHVDWLEQRASSKLNSRSPSGILLYTCRHRRYAESLANFWKRVLIPRSSRENLEAIHPHRQPVPPREHFVEETLVAAVLLPYPQLAVVPLVVGAILGVGASDPLDRLDLPARFLESSEGFRGD
nr:hypothetical protein Iba_chr13cCG14700 [Ipomoea batatas]